MTSWWLQYQPIVDLPTEAVVGVEALVRWQHPTRGLLGPNEFIQHAEENGAIVGIGKWVLREALRTFMGWRAAAPDSALRYVSVNVSARQFRTPGFVDEVRAALADTGAQPQCAPAGDHREPGAARRREGLGRPAGAA